ncbi:MAG TPA: hypothetical protein VIY08_14085 [Candidatus Nitrosocosmicus sp.]
MANIQFPQMTVLDIQQDCRFLKLKHHLHSWEENVNERMMQYQR